MKRLVRWAVCVFMVVVVLGVASVLLRNTMAKQLLERRLRFKTGLEPKIGIVDIGLLAPTITVENVRIYNTAEFGGGLFLDLPELHLEYDPAAFRAGELHFKLVRLNLAQLSLVQDKKGRMNVQDAGKRSKMPGIVKKSRLPLKFTGIDTLNLTLGRFHAANLASGREEDLDFGIKDQIIHNVKTLADIPSLGFLLATHDSSSSNASFDLDSLLNGLTAH